MCLKCNINTEGLLYDNWTRVLNVLNIFSLKYEFQYILFYISILKRESARDLKSCTLPLTLTPRVLQQSLFCFASQAPPPLSDYFLVNLCFYFIFQFQNKNGSYWNQSNHCWHHWSWICWLWRDNQTWNEGGRW